jgi:alkanesulfonate monooxygenase SsuD/methylene tetrahydromethanopterin reductase-like flavin-dependent oxidoreductase (luciferase family)
MNLDLHVWRFDWTGSPATMGAEVGDLAVQAEATGIRTLSFMDHFFQMEAMAPAEDPMLEGYTALGFVAGRTETLRLRLLVTGVTYRHPGLLAKTVATLDVLSAGRAELGIGAAWYEREHRGLGVPFRRWPSASSASRRPCRSACRCGARTTGRTRVRTTSWPRPSAGPRRSARHDHRS